MSVQNPLEPQRRGDTSNGSRSIVDPANGPPATARSIATSDTGDGGVAPSSGGGGAPPAGSNAATLATLAGQQQHELTYHATWQATERDATAARDERTAETKRQLLGYDVPYLPTVAVALSGGGWRAMSSSVAFLDGLSTPLAPAATATGAPGVKLLDTVTTIAGLSGGSWALAAMLAGGLRNPFHAAPTSTTAPGGVDNPWLHGEQHHFTDPTTTAGEAPVAAAAASAPTAKGSDLTTSCGYAGLLAIRSRTNVDDAAYRSSLRSTVAKFLRSAFVETTIPAVLLSRSMGTCFVERWANFIANNILAFADNYAPPTVSPEESEAFRDSRQIALQDLQRLVHRGDLPFCILSTVGNRTLEVGEALGPTVRLFDWLEHTPFFTRNHSARILDTTGELCVVFPDHDPDEADSDEDLAAAFSDATYGRVPLKLHHLMAIAGSAFAFNLSIVAPQSVRNLNHKAELLEKELRLEPEKLKKDVAVAAVNPVLGGVTKVVIHENAKIQKARRALAAVDEDDVAAGTGGGHTPTDAERQAHAERMNSGEVFIGVLRDAGIDFNVPLPPLSPESGRAVDIIVVHDAGEGAANAHELQRAVDLGYLKLAPTAPSPLDPFPTSASDGGGRVRVFRGAPGYPTVIYFLGVTDAPTTEIVVTPEALLAQLADVRTRTVQHLQPLLLAELQRCVGGGKHAKASRKSSQVPQPDTAAAGAAPRPPAGGDDADGDGKVDGTERAFCCSMQ